MRLVEKLNEMNLSIYKLSLESGIAKSTLNDIFIGKSSLYDCSGKTLLSIASVLGISIEELLSLKQEDYKIEYERNLPEFLQDGIEKLKKSKRHKDSFYDCYLMEVNSSINVCEVEHIISSDQANYLRNKFLRS
jgi:transcriptional regulator with XRE-family HTH domain